MTNVERPRRRRPWLAIGVASLVLGVLTVGASVPLVMLEATGWPWHASISSDGGRGHAEIDLEGGATEQFTGTTAEAQAWLAEREAELKAERGIPMKIAIGKVLAGTGYLLIGLGGGILLWRSAAFVATRPRAKPA